MNSNDAANIWEELRHRDSDGKIAWLRALATSPTDESVETLVRVLEVESWFVRDQAARLLGTLGERVVELLSEQLDSGLWYTRSAAAMALGRTGSPLGAVPLVCVLLDPNRTVRDSGWEAIARICDTDAGRFAVASAIHRLEPRRRQFVLDGFAARNGGVADAIHLLLREPAHLSQGGFERLDRAVNEDGSYLWEDVVGGDGVDPSRA